MAGGQGNIMKNHNLRATCGFPPVVVQGPPTRCTLAPLHALRVAVGVVVMICCAGCGPRYKTFYSLTPPSSATGLQCLNGCQTTLQQCEANQQYEYQNCENRKLQEFQICESQKIMAPDPLLGWSAPICVQNCWCYKESCGRPSDEICKSRYYECYSNCGGNVSTTTVCVANCDKQNGGAQTM